MAACSNSSAVGRLAGGGGSGGFVASAVLLVVVVKLTPCSNADRLADSVVVGFVSVLVGVVIKSGMGNAEASGIF